MKRIIAVYGADHCVGTSQIAQSLAKVLAEMGEKILFIDASSELYDGYTGLSYEYNGIDMIKKRISPIQAVISCEDFDVILGVRSTSKMSYKEGFFKEILEELPDYSRVIIDAGSDARESLSKEALIAADMRMFVVRQNPKCIDKFRIYAEEVLGPGNLYNADDIVIINALRKSKMLYTKEQVEAALLKSSATLPFVSDGIKSEYSKKSLAELDKGFNRKLIMIINDYF